MLSGKHKIVIKVKHTCISCTDQPTTFQTKRNHDLTIYSEVDEKKMTSLI